MGACCTRAQLARELRERVFDSDVGQEEVALLKKFHPSFSDNALPCDEIVFGDDFVVDRLTHASGSSSLVAPRGWAVPGMPSETRNDDDVADPQLLDPRVPLVAVSGLYKFIVFFRLDTGERVYGLNMHSRLRSGLDLANCHVGGVPCLAVAGASAVMLVDLEAKRYIGDGYDGHTDEVRTVTSLSFDGGEEDHLLASGSDDKTVRLWRPESMSTKIRELVVFEGHSRFVTDLCCVPSRRWLASSSLDDTVRLWDVERERRVTIFDHGAIRGREMMGVTSVVSGSEDSDADSDCLFCCSHVGVVSRISLKACRIDRLCPERLPACSTLLLHPTRPHYLLTGHNCGEIRLFDLRMTRECVTKERIHHGVVNRISYVGNGAFASCSRDRSVRLWTDGMGAYFQEGELVGAMSAREGNCGLSCIVPFEERERGEVAMEEKMEMYLGGVAVAVAGAGGRGRTCDADAGRLGILAASMFVRVALGSDVVGVFRFVMLSRE